MKLQYLELSLSTPAADLACDEALLDWCERHGGGGLLRIWEPTTAYVVLGYANRAAREVNLPVCRTLRIPVYRRCSGGGTVLQGPGCLNYTVVLPIESHPSLAGIPGTTRFVLGRHRQMLNRHFGFEVACEGSSDLVRNRRKISGNAQRRRRHYLLFHGTFLLNLDLGLMEEVLPLPSQQPDYRRARSHSEFAMNLGLPAKPVKAALQEWWQAREPFVEVPWGELNRLAQEKYSSDAWNYKF